MGWCGRGDCALAHLVRVRPETAPGAWAARALLDRPRAGGRDRRRDWQGTLATGADARLPLQCWPQRGRGGGCHRRTCLSRSGSMSLAAVIWVLAGLLGLVVAMLGAVAITALLLGFNLYLRLAEKRDAR